MCDISNPHIKHILDIRICIKTKVLLLQAQVTLVECGHAYDIQALQFSCSPGTPASSTTKTGRHDIAEILLKKSKIKSNLPIDVCFIHVVQWIMTFFVYFICQSTIKPITLFCDICSYSHISSRYVFSCVICFRFIHFNLISTAHALFLTCLPVSIYGT